MSVFRQKLNGVIDHIYRHEYQLAISSIEAFQQKDKKQKASLSQEHLLTLDIVKCYCLVKSLRLGQAAPLFLSLLPQLPSHPSLPDELRFLELPSQVLGHHTLFLEQISLNAPLTKALEYDEKLFTRVLSYWVKAKQWKKCHQLAQTLYKRNKKPDTLFESVYFQYRQLRTLEPAQALPQYKLALLFLNKFFKEKGLDLATLQPKDVEQSQVVQAAVRLHLKIILAQKDFPAVYSLLSRFRFQISNNQKRFFYFLAIYRKVEAQLQDENSWQQLVEAHWAVLHHIFQKEFMHLESIQQFVDILLSRAEQVSIQEQESLAECWTSVSDFSPAALLKTFFSQMKATRLHLNKKSHNYKHLQKLCVQSQLYFLQKALPKCEQKEEAKGQILSLLKEYFDLFGAKLTFLEEVEPFLRGLEGKESEEYRSYLEGWGGPAGKEDALLRQLNREKVSLFWENSVLMEESSRHAFLSRMLHTYQTGYDSLYKDYKLDKGERLIVDEFLLLALDALLHSIFSRKQLHPEETSLAAQLVELGLQRSPYNYDLALRGIQIYQEVGCQSRVLELVGRLDVKSSLFHSLGFLYLWVFYEFNLGDSQKQEVVAKALSFYHEVQQESLQTLGSCLKTANTEQLGQFLSYENITLHSHNHLLFLEQLLQNLQEQPRKNRVDVEYLLQLLSSCSSSSLKEHYDRRIAQPRLLFAHSPFTLPSLGLMQDQSLLQARILSLYLSRSLDTFLEDSSLDSSLSEHDAALAQILESAFARADNTNTLTHNSLDIQLRSMRDLNRIRSLLIQQVLLKHSQERHSPESLQEMSLSVENLCSAMLNIMRSLFSFDQPRLDLNQVKCFNRFQKDFLDCFRQCLLVVAAMLGGVSKQAKKEKDKPRQKSMTALQKSMAQKLQECQAQMLACVEESQKSFQCRGGDFGEVPAALREWVQSFCRGHCIDHEHESLLNSLKNTMKENLAVLKQVKL